MADKKAIGVHHVAMNVADIERSISFYEEAFGFTLAHRWGGGSKAAMLDMGDGTMLELFERPDGAGQSGSLLHIALHSDDVDADYAHALASGATVQSEPTDVDIPAEPMFPVRIAFVKGPDGESVELFHER
jgi:glyoxylase I family protein